MRESVAQQTGKSKVYRIAVVDPQTAVAEQRENPYSAGSGFFEELRRLGYFEGRNLVVEQFSSETRASITAYWPPRCRGARPSPPPDPQV
jgi:hypothetical protein